jgi:hypothetical protein
LVSVLAAEQICTLTGARDRSLERALATLGPDILIRLHDELVAAPTPEDVQAAIKRALATHLGARRPERGFDGGSGGSP